jgi:hypothetical protein
MKMFLKDGFVFYLICWLGGIDTIIGAIYSTLGNDSKGALCWAMAAAMYSLAGLFSKKKDIDRDPPPLGSPPKSIPETWSQ